MNTYLFFQWCKYTLFFQILYVQKIEDTQAKALEAVEAEIEEQLYTEFVDNKYQEWLQELKARSHIRIIN